MFWIDPVYFWYVFIPTMLISLGVQLYLKSTFSKWSRVPNGSKLTGVQTAQQLFARTSLNAIPVERVRGSLTDHFDPGANIVRLSDPVSTQPTVASMAVAAHELGHVQQYQTGSGLIKMRSALLPAIQFSPTLSYMSLMFGLIFNMTNLIWLGVFFFALMVLFSLLTLPVELDASRRALKLLDEAGLMRTDEDRKGARAVLRAAALTYLAAAIASVLQLLYYVSIARRASN
ncbi:MAG: zinc metallopeptidase [Chloroflexota bacterium]|jgi:Zn-dependent membrane protease YugP|nr:zinc metallopeptidase [Caldilinea sp.]GIK72547.1 MAG: zinc metallopeptidase [Chloroflexota bacterium]